MKLLPLLLLTAGCTVMVNGKPHKLGGTDPEPAQAKSPGEPAPPAQPGEAPARPAQIIKVDDTLSMNPRVVHFEGVVFDTTYSHVHGLRGATPDCGNDMTSQPIASIQIDKPPQNLTIALAGGSNDGFVLQKDGLVWFVCGSVLGNAPGISSLKEGWQPGRYDIYPISHSGKYAHPTFDLELVDPTKPVVWPEATKKITLAHKLPTPMFVEVTTRPDRRKLREFYAGDSCTDVALPDTPDLVVELERPIPGLVIRPLPTAQPVKLRRENQDAKQTRKWCPRSERGYQSAGHGPTYHADSEIHFDHDAEGKFGISVGTADAAHPTTVTLMIFDASTAFDPLAKYPYPGDAEALERRWIGWHFPQLDLGDITATHDYAHAELAAKLFAAAPREAFVYAKLDMDKDIASGESEQFPKKNEPLLITDYGSDRSVVLAADGLKFTVKASHLLLKPDGALAVPRAPRPMHKLDLGAVIGLLPPSAKALSASLDKKYEAWEKCTDRVWEPYGNQLPTITHPAGVDIIVYETPHERHIKEAGQAAMDRTCGTREALDKQSEAMRVKMMAEIEKARVKLLAQATTSLH